MDILKVKAEWNFAVHGHYGVPSAETNGPKIILMLFVVLLAMMTKVRICFYM